LQDAQLSRLEATHKCSDSPQEIPYTLLRFLALRLLASCYTLLPASSAENFPLYEQRTSTTLISSLTLQSHHRLSPAAGHHARAPSESSPWPGLASGPSLEDQLAELVTSKRRLEGYLKNPLRNQLDVIPLHTPISEIKALLHENGSASEDTPRREMNESVRASRACIWSDSPASDVSRDRSPSNSPGSSPSAPTPSSSASSRPASEKRLLFKLLCQPFKIKEAKPKNRPIMIGHGSFLSKLLPSTSKSSRTEAASLQQRPKLLLSSPNSFKSLLRRTKSAPRTTNNQSTAAAEEYERRNSSDPTTVESLHRPHFQIPDIRRISATTVDQDDVLRSTGSLNEVLAGRKYSDQMILEILEESKLSPPDADDLLWTRRLSTSSSNISPGTVEPGKRPPRNSYFGAVPLESEPEEVPQPKERKGKWRGFDRWIQQQVEQDDWGDDDSDKSSDVGADILGKRANTVLRPVTFDRKSMKRLERQ
jgi:hypothetical protein